MHSCSMTVEANLCELTATTLAKALARREISARAVLEAHLARIAAHDARLSAFITVDADGARRQADACDAAARSDRTSAWRSDCRKGSHQHEGFAHDVWIFVVPKPRAGSRRARGGEASAGRRCYHWQDQHAGIRFWRGVHKSAVRTDAQSVRCRVDIRWLLWRFCCRRRNRNGPARTRHRFRRLGAYAGKFLRCGLDPSDTRPDSGARARPWLGHARYHGLLARSVDDLELGLSACADPTFSIRCRSAPSLALDLRRDGRNWPSRLISAWRRLRRSPLRALPRLAMRCREIADVEEVSPDCSGAIEAFRTLRAAHVADSYGALLRDRRAELTPTVIWNIEAGGQLTAQDYLAAERRRTAVYRGFRDLLAARISRRARGVGLPWNKRRGGT